MPRWWPERNAGFQKLIALGTVLLGSSYGTSGPGASLVNATSVYHSMDVPRTISSAVIREDCWTVFILLQFSRERRKDRGSGAIFCCLLFLLVPAQGRAELVSCEQNSWSVHTPLVRLSASTVSHNPYFPEIVKLWEKIFHCFKKTRGSTEVNQFQCKHPPSLFTCGMFMINRVHLICDLLT